ncbi:MAG: hypothetical protein ACI4PH_02680 [Faecousia sp.]
MKNILSRLFCVLLPTVLGINLFPGRNTLLAFLALCSVLLIPAMMKETGRGFSVHQKWMLYFSIPTLIQLTGFLVTGNEISLICALVCGIVFVFEWKFKVISDRWKP